METNLAAPYGRKVTAVLSGKGNSRQESPVETGNKTVDENKGAA